MLKKNKIRIAAVAAASIAIAAITANVAFAAVQATGSDGPVYIYDAGTEVLVPAGHTFAWDEDVVGSAASNSALSRFTCPADATSARTFIAPVNGSTHPPIASWIARADALFVPTTKQIQEFPANLSAQINGAPLSVKSAGGTYWLGLACTTNSGATLASTGVWYAVIHVTAGTGAWTVDQPDAVAAPPVGSADVNLQATTIGASDGTLSLVAPTNSTAIIGNPTLVNNLSTSTGTLGNFQVQDGRVVSHPGWTLTSTVIDFTNSADSSITIDKKQLGVAPKLVSTTAAAAAITIAAPQVAGGSVFPAAFASASNSAQVGNTTLDADLVFVSPANKPAGTYTSKLTLTLASN
jgi:hypothetical protein